MTTALTLTGGGRTFGRARSLHGSVETTRARRSIAAFMAYLGRAADAAMRRILDILVSLCRTALERKEAAVLAYRQDVIAPAQPLVTQQPAEPRPASCVVIDTKRNAEILARAKVEHPEWLIGPSARWNGARLVPSAR